ncbi:HSP20-like chaperone [Phaffia rhodozyma]|uniref:HSP20-like chaperone n=1 Tax=Phaffia rhodozyma TaxID=264483 RepID=A0A0F7SVM2_PHARH|nr:HSP20-like chaperone [Phaffia rhodozyma]
MYTYHQSYGQITILVELPPGTRSRDVQVDLTSNTIRAGVQGFPALIKGRLVAPIRTEMSEWFLEGRSGSRKQRRRMTSGPPSNNSSSSEDSVQAKVSKVSRGPVTEFLDKEDLKRTLSPLSSHSASSFDLFSAASQPSSQQQRSGPVHLDRPGASRSSSQGSSDEIWTTHERQPSASNIASDEGELIDHPLASSVGSISGFSDPSSDDFVRTDPALLNPHGSQSIAPSSANVTPSRFNDFPALSSFTRSSGQQPSSTLPLSARSTESSESSASPSSASSTGSGPGVLSNDGDLTPDANEPQSRLLTIHLIKAEGAIWAGLVIVGPVGDGKDEGGTWAMDWTSLVALAVEWSGTDDKRDEAFEMLLYAHRASHLPLATFHLLQIFFPLPQLSQTTSSISTLRPQPINPIHLLRLGGTQTLAKLYVIQAERYLSKTNPPDPLPHQRYPLDRPKRDFTSSLMGEASSAESKAGLAKRFIRVARDLDPEVELTSELEGFGEEALRDHRGGEAEEWSSGASGSEEGRNRRRRRRGAAGRGHAEGRGGTKSDNGVGVGVYVFGGATLVLVVAVGISWWKKPKAD